jgi:hypothetical protein
LDWRRFMLMVALKRGAVHRLTRQFVELNIPRQSELIVRYGGRLHQGEAVQWTVGFATLTEFTQELCNL